MFILLQAFEIPFVFYRGILQAGSWPTNMKYLTCDEYDGTNNPTHSIDFKSYFIEVSVCFDT